MTLRLFLIVMALFSISSQVHGQQPTVTLELIPQGVLDSRQSQLYITVESPQDLNNAVLQINTSTDFRADSSTISLPSVTRSIIENVTITLINPRLLSGDQALTVTLSVPGDSGSRRVLVSKIIKFAYTPEISLSIFFVFAAAGLILGYWVRLIIKVLGNVTPPSPAPVPVGTSTGPITKFVQDHYYLVDFIVTLALALIVLATVAAGGRPPQSGTSWYGALATGVGIGLFTNSELLTRLRR